MIQKTIHHIVGASPNALIKRCLASWQKLKKEGFEIVIWNDESILKFVAKNYPFVLDALTNSRNHAEAADIARYAIIYHFGGHYIDWDIELLDIPQFLKLCDDNANGYLVQDPANQSLASEAFAALPGELLLLNLIKNIASIYKNGFRDTLQTPWYSGPFRMREVYYAADSKSELSLIPLKEVFLYDYSEIRLMPSRTVNVAMIHYWMHSWMS